MTHSNSNNNLKRLNNNKLAKKTTKKNISIKNSNAKNSTLKGKKFSAFNNTKFAKLNHNITTKKIQTISPLTPLSPFTNANKLSPISYTINSTNPVSNNYYDGIYQTLNNTLNNRIVNNKLGKNQTPLNFIHKKTLFQEGDAQCKKYVFEQHGISRNQISSAAIEVCSVLQKRGFAAFIVGGAIRDLLLGAIPKDFDVVTNATPFQVLDSFKTAFLIGRRFQIVHVKIAKEIIEVSTFRSKQENETAYDEFGKVINDNIFGSHSEDASRRDFTINSFYYDPITQELLDYHNGIQDMSQKVLRIIGDPEIRYREDPVRMIRAIRLAAKLQLTIDKKSLASFQCLGELLHHVNKSRLCDEMIKILISGYSLNCLSNFKHQKVPLDCMPLFDYIFSNKNNNTNNVDIDNFKTLELKRKMITAILEKTDSQVRQNRINGSNENIDVAFIFAALLWFDMLLLRNKYFQQESHNNLIVATQQAISELMQEMNKDIISRKYISEIRGIWLIQQIFESQIPKQIFKLSKIAYVEEAFEFLKLRHQIGEINDDLMTWWKNFMHSNIQNQKSLVEELIQLRIWQKKQQKLAQNTINDTDSDENSDSEKLENSEDSQDNDFEEVNLEELDKIKKILPIFKHKRTKKLGKYKRFLNTAKHKSKSKR